MTMKTLGRIAIGVSLLWAATTWAGGEGGKEGGGGNAVVCFKDPVDLEWVAAHDGFVGKQLLDRIESIEAYDLFEAGQKTGIPPVSPKLVEIAQGESAVDYAIRLLHRLDALLVEDSEGVEYKAHLRERILRRYDSKLVIDQAEGVEQVIDVNPTGQIDRTRCRLVTLAFQTNTAEKLKLSIDSRLFYHSKHSLRSQGVLFLHELVYSYARTLDWKNKTHFHPQSDHVRALVAALLRQDLTDQELRAVLIDEKFVRDARPIQRTWSKTNAYTRNSDRMGYGWVHPQNEPSFVEVFARANPRYVEWVLRSADRLLDRYKNLYRYYLHDSCFSADMSFAARYKCIQDLARFSPEAQEVLATMERSYFPQLNKFRVSKLMEHFRKFDEPYFLKMFPDSGPEINAALERSFERGNYVCDYEPLKGDGFFMLEFSEQDDAILSKPARIGFEF